MWKDPSKISDLNCGMDYNSLWMTVSCRYCYTRRSQMIPTAYVCILFLVTHIRSFSWINNWQRETVLFYLFIGFSFCTFRTCENVFSSHLCRNRENSRGLTNSFYNTKLFYCSSEFPDDVNPITKEKGGPRGPEPTRYGDWERKGRCVDF